MTKGGKKSAAELRLERRRFARFDVQWPVEYPLFGETAFASTENISRGGMLVAGVPIMPEEDVEFSLHGLGVDPLLIPGRVCRHGDAGTHVEFIDVSGDPGTAIEQFIERNIIPDLIGDLTGTRRDTQTLRLVSSWYRELGNEDRALDVCRGVVRGATTAGPYEELAGMLMTRAKRLGVRGGLEHVAEARQVIGQGLRVVASPVLVRLYQESTLVEERLSALVQQQEAERLHTTQQRDILADLESTTSQRPIPPELLAKARRTDLSLDDTMPTDPMVPVGTVTDPSMVVTNPSLLLTTDPTLPVGDVTDPSLPPGLAVTDPDVPVRPAAVDAVAVVFAADAPLTDPMLVAPAPRSTEAVYHVAERPRRWGRVVAVLALLAAGAAGFWMVRSGFIHIPALGDVESAAFETDELEALPLAGLSNDPVDEEQYEELVELEPDLLARPPDGKKARRKRRRSRRSRHGSPATEAMSTAAPAVAPPAGDRYARAKDYFKDRKILLAIEELEALTRERPRHVDAYRMLGVAYGLVGREPSSIGAFRRLVKIAPRHKDAPKIRAIIEAYQQRNPGE